MRYPSNPCDAMFLDSDSKRLTNRRGFLLKAAAIALGGCAGLGVFSETPAAELKALQPITPHIALIIDDIGYSVSRAHQFLALDIPLTFAVLPRLVKSRPLALAIHRQGHEVMLHQPMEPYNPLMDPGPGALYVGDAADRIAAVLQENIDAIPFAIGVNNHMGSKFTSSQTEIGAALRTIRRKGLFFVDSRTSCRSKALKTAHSLALPAAGCNIFLDHYPEEEAIDRQLERLRDHARKHGRAVGIGHPRPQTAAAIRRFVDGHSDFRAALVSISQLV